ncbi:hypothetical protein ADK67_43530 [Saccharothrix sp. NRRL B-16348]|uniref:type IV toxin-antitoxin system AbiEi family antitoxin n=1 Tax=Saccharothrix sp. NRRL B-16348 TaxID=1415542 RepID=UPI0006AF600F|nr:type IV toxin-antitoxin system AbiEi family antitoxin [Saccharothrix sp. NRRL B-16348]KOX13787.1 hypothetical protein ADK67_43530 [Saccharothrix sp. NRRL B-16348]
MAGEVRRSVTVAMRQSDVQHGTMFNENEQGQILNKHGPWAPFEDLLRQLGLHVVVRSSDPGADGGADVLAEVSRGSGASQTYVVQAKRHVPPELATALHHPHASLPTLVFAHSITERAAELLRERAIDYIDAAGNAHIAWNDVLIDVRGRRKAVQRPEAPSSRGSKAFSRAGLQVVLVLLSWPHMAGEPLRRLARASAVSLGTAKAVVDDLSKVGYLYDVRGVRRLARAGELLSRWSEAYSTTLSPSLFLDGFSVEDMSWWSRAKEELAGSNVQLGGEVAATLIDSHLVPATLTLYADEVPRALVRRHRMLPAGKDGNVQFRRRFWQVEDEGWAVPSVLTYADLLASGDPRQREHADRIRRGDDRLAELDRL